MDERCDYTPAALYARVSSDRQDIDLSVAAQLRALRDHARKNDYMIVREYVDEAESGRIADRPQFRRMIDEATKPEAPFREILVWKFSGFTRKREHAVAFKSMLRRKGVRVVSITEHADDTPIGKLMEAIIESVDEFYSENLAQEVTRGMRESASRGFWISSHAPYGYNRVMVQDGPKKRPTLEINPDTSRIVRAHVRHGRSRRWDARNHPHPQQRRHLQPQGEAQASIKSFRRREDQEGPPDDDSGNPSVDFRGERLRNETHRSRTDPEARLMRKGKGKEARLSFMGHALMENGNGLLTDFVVSRATGTAERDAFPCDAGRCPAAGLSSQDPGPRPWGEIRATTRGSVSGAMRNRGVTPHVAQRTPLGYRRSHHTASGLQDEPEDSQAGGGDIRVDEDCGRISADPVSGSGAHRAGRILGGHGLQPGADGQPAVATGGPGRSVGVTCPWRSPPQMA